MPKWEVKATETVHYVFEVEAESEEKAYEEAKTYPASGLDITESWGFEVLSIVKSDDAGEDTKASEKA